MHLDSFVLIPCPAKTDGGLFKLLGAFERTYDNGDTEDYYILAFAATHRQEIQNLVFYCFEQHLHMKPTNENVVHAAILASCANLLHIRPDGTNPTEERAEHLRKTYNVNIDRHDMIFLGGMNGNMEFVKLSMEALMSSNK